MRGTVSRSAAIAAIGALALAAAGCGKSDKTLTRGEFVAQTDAICKRLLAQRKAIKIKTQKEFAQALPRVGSYERTAFAKLGRLTPPASLASDWNQLVTSGQALAETTVQLGKYLRAHNAAAARLKFQSAAALSRAMSATAAQDGIKACTHI